MLKQNPAANPGKLVHGRETGIILEAFYHAYNGLTRGLPESVYQNALGVALRMRGLRYEQEVRYVVHFEGVNVGVFRADLVVDDRIIIEVKCARRITKAHINQVRFYLNASTLPVGMLLNFGPVPTFKRVVSKTAYRSPDPRSSA